MKSRLHMFLAIAMLAFFANLNNAAGQDAKEQIRGRMKERYPALMKAKAEGKIGETAPGFVEIVSEKDAKNEVLKKLAEEENADRKQLYTLIAGDTKTTAETVGKQNALRLFERAGGSEYFKGEDGKWKQKKDLKVEEKKQQ
ncbi:MAG: YdbL family protein [bacterium]